jgi:hypothetical protein
MDLPRAAQALAPRAGSSQGLGPESYLNSTSQGELVLPVPSVVAGSQAKGGHIRGRSRRFVKHAG